MGTEIRPYKEVIESERLLVRLGHIVWYMRKRSLKSNDADAVRAFDGALEIIWDIKRQVRQELKAARTEETERIRSRCSRDVTLPVAA
jgi:hypothetical protein